MRATGPADPATAGATWADRACAGWVGLYTRGLPPEIAERRREELRSDLFEHAAVAGPGPAHQADVLGRVLWGIPADLSWRRAARAPQERRLETGVNMNLRKTTTVLVGLAAAFFVWLGVGVWVGVGGEEGSDAGGVRYGLPLLVAAAVMAYALRCRDEAPRRSTVLIVVAAATPVAVLYWMAPIFVPVWLLLSGLAIASEPGRRQPVPAT